MLLGHPNCNPAQIDDAYACFAYYLNYMPIISITELESLEPYFSYYQSTVTKFKIIFVASLYEHTSSCHHPGHQKLLENI